MQRERERGEGEERGGREEEVGGEKTSYDNCASNTTKFLKI